jgi:hypothetical protein
MITRKAVPLPAVDLLRKSTGAAGMTGSGGISKNDRRSVCERKALFAEPKNPVIPERNRGTPVIASDILCVA